MTNMTLQTDNSHPKLDHDYLKDIRVVIEMKDQEVWTGQSFGLTHPFSQSVIN